MTTYASHITVCDKCATPVSCLTADDKGRTLILPCGHNASIVVVPNPDLPEA